MILKLAKKKEINEDVLRMIIQYGLGFASRVKNLENKEIEDWKEDKLYEKGAKVLYNNYLWVAKVTNQSSTWNENYWEKIGDNLELIDLDTIKTMLGLTTDELQTLSSIISDSEVRLDKTYSSSKIYTDLQQCLNDSKKFTLDQFAKANKASYQVITNLSSATDKSIIYLMANGSNYDMYIVESDGTPTKIGDTTIDLSQFYTKTEIDNDFVKKTDADGKHATITTVDGKVDKTSILSAISSNPSDDKLLSEKAIKSELDNLKTNFQDGVNTIYDSVVARGVTPTDKSPSSIVEALDKTFNNSILIKEYSSDGLKIYDNRGIIEEGGYYKDEKYKICYVNVICLSKVDLDYGGGSGCLLLISGLPMPLIQNTYSNPTFLSIENIDNPNRQCKAGYGIDRDGINGCIFMNPFNNNERVRIYGAYQYSES